MYVQCQSSDKKFSRLGSCTGYTNAYTNDKEARDSFFESLIKETDFYTDGERTCKFRVLTVKRAGKKGSPYLEFTAIGDFFGTPNVPIIGLVAFQSPAKFKIVERPKFKIIKKN